MGIDTNDERLREEDGAMLEAMGEPGKNLSVADVIVLSGWDPYMLLVWNGNSWTIDKVLPERQARAEYEQHKAAMPNCPIKLVKMEVAEEHAG